MTLKEYIKSKKLSIMSLQKETGVPYSTISDIINGKTNIDNTNVSVFIKLSRALKLTLDDFYTYAKNTSPIPLLENGYKIKMTKGKYIIEHNGTVSYLCKNTDINATFIEDIAGTYIRNQKRKERMDSWMINL